MGSRGVVLLGFAMALAACGKPVGINHTSVPTFEVPELESERESYLRRFPLLNEQEEEKPVVDPHSGRSPFGALVYMPKQGGRGGYCTLTHLRPGVLATNAHCVDSDDDAFNYFAIFYNKRGVKRYERVVAFDFVGSRGGVDMALLRLDPDAVEQWDVMQGEYYDSSSERGREPALVHDVILWSFNPIVDNHPDLVKKYGKIGMRFAPRHCKGSRKQPEITAYLKDDPETPISIRHSIFKEEIHWFLDGCDQGPVQGNSGSLMTDDSPVRKLFGVMHSSFHLPDMEPYLRFDYLGNVGYMPLRPQDLPKQGFYTVGSDFAAAPLR